MEREEALTKLRLLIGQDLRPLAGPNQVTVEKGDKINKGWAGHVIERYLGLPLNSSQSPNFGSWELKVIPLKYLKSGVLQVKETMAVTMIDPVEVSKKEFEESHVYSKLRKIVVVSRIFETPKEEASRVYSVSQFDLDDPVTFATVKDDYDLIREAIIKTATPDKAPNLSGLSGTMGKYIQPRTKGAGHGSTSRAFYARTGFVAHIVGLNVPIVPPIIDNKAEPEDENNRPDNDTDPQDDDTDPTP